ncbi:SAF domain-containing protein [Corallococcus carmarthensis]|nr:SAF domain-containing protein [Corallococcus carmarthensis]
MSPFLRGLGVGITISVLGAGTFAAVTTRKYLARVHQGWATRPALLLTHDVAPGHVLTEEDLTEVLLPEQFLTSAWVPGPERATVLGKAVTLPVEKDAPLLWTSFALYHPEQVSACIAAVHPGFQQALDRTRAELLASLSQEAPPSRAVPPPPPFQFDADRQALVLVTTAEVKKGDRIEASALEARKLPRALVTASLVPAEALKSVAGAVAVVPLAAGEPVRWQFLADPKQPRSVALCARQLEEAGEKNAPALEQQVQAFFNETREGR